MQKMLTTKLLNGLVSQGYRYCYSKTTAIVGDDANICITLVPVKTEPSLINLPEKFDTYFDLAEEPVQMALGVDETIILVDLVDMNAFKEVSP
ncbi:hypothetical protein IDJ77_04445 [Mucilaginibacter sp. ZT4R22]|uniref:Uncharacterized protein n=1 Tax=Mucilaginibacter pankratovii TaxID=2772110 RepID=A0ABR7WNI2_9SPHI|nr:hypothetical protein [Mucilaginibacter pankratovii]MBD1363052.1 hypothetical protein [Mucilaginibacter pankratovii]